MIERKRPLLFLIVGIGNTILDFTIYSLLAFTLFSHSLAVAGIVSGTIALIVAFLGHAFITWRGRTIKKITIVKFFVITGFGMWAMRPLLLTWFAKLDWLYEYAYSLSEDLDLPFSYDFVVTTGAFGFMIVILLAYNYLTYDRFVFSDKRNVSRTDLKIH